MHITPIGGTQTRPEIPWNLVSSVSGKSPKTMLRLLYEPCSKYLPFCKAYSKIPLHKMLSYIFVLANCLGFEMNLLNSRSVQTHLLLECFNVNDFYIGNSCKLGIVPHLLLLWTNVTMWLWRNPDNVTHRQLLSIDQVWCQSTALTWSRWGCRRLADNIWLLAHDNNHRDGKRYLHRITELRLCAQKTAGTDVMLSDTSIY